MEVTLSGFHLQELAQCVLHCWATVKTESANLLSDANPLMENLYLLTKKGCHKAGGSFICVTSMMEQ